MVVVAVQGAPLLYILPSVDSNIQSPGPCPELGSNERALEINMASKYGRMNVVGLVIYHSAMQPDKRKDLRSG